MIESIGTRLTSLMAEILPINLSEAETNTYPYATYEQTPTRLQGKDGETLRIRSEVVIHIYDKVFSTAEGKKDLVAAAIASNMHDDTFGASLRTVNKDCSTGVWDIEMNYTIVQYKDYEPIEEITPNP
jgi:hypothetical protein